MSFSSRMSWSESQDRDVFLTALKTRYPSEWLRRQSLIKLSNLMFDEMDLAQGVCGGREDRGGCEARANEIISHSERKRGVGFEGVSSMLVGGVNKPEIHILLQMHLDWSRVTSEQDRKMVDRSQHHILLYLQHMKRNRKEPIVLFPESFTSSVQAEEWKKAEPDALEKIKKEFPNDEVTDILSASQQACINEFSTPKVAAFLGLVDSLHQFISVNDSVDVARDYAREFAIGRRSFTSAPTVRAIAYDRRESLLAQEIQSFVNEDKKKSIICVTIGNGHSRSLPKTLTFYNLHGPRIIDTVRMDIADIVKKRSDPIRDQTQPADQKKAPGRKLSNKKFERPPQPADQKKAPARKLSPEKEFERPPQPASAFTPTISMEIDQKSNNPDTPIDSEMSASSLYSMTIDPKSGKPACLISNIDADYLNGAPFSFPCVRSSDSQRQYFSWFRWCMKQDDWKPDVKKLSDICAYYVISNLLLPSEFQQHGWRMKEVHTSQLLQVLTGRFKDQTFSEDWKNPNLMFGKGVSTGSSFELPNFSTNDISEDIISIAKKEILIWFFGTIRPLFFNKGETDAKKELRTTEEHELFCAAAVYLIMYVYLLTTEMPSHGTRLQLRIEIEKRSRYM